MPLFYLSCSWVAGIFLGTEFNLPLALLLTGLIPLPLLFLTRRHRKLIIVSGLSLIAFFAAGSYAYSSLHTITENDLRFYNDRGITEIRGMVYRNPELRDKTTHLHLRVDEIKLQQDWQTVEGKTLLIVSRYPADLYQYGDVLHVTGDLQTPPRFDGFDYKDYLAHRGIRSIFLYPGIEIEGRGRGFKPLEWVYAAREHTARTLSAVLPEPQASLAQGIILGIRGNIPASTRADFARTGTAHLLAISGLHLGIIAGIMLGLGTWLFGRRHYLYVWLALGIIWLYALLTGMHPPVVRGAIMASLFLTAELLGRQRSAITALAFAAAIMVGLSPYILGDAAFQLSFLAMSGLVFLFPALKSLGRKTVKTTIGENGPAASLASAASDSLSATLAALIAVWPLVAYYFGIISFTGPLATFLALPALPGIIITGALTGGLGFIALPAAQVVSWLTWLFLTYLLLIVNGLAASPLSFINTGPVNVIPVLAYYLVLGTIFFILWRRPAAPVRETAARLKSGLNRSLDIASRLPVRWVMPPLALIALLVSLTAASMPDDRLHVSFLDVGQGDAILIQQGSRQVLVDGGPSPQAINLELGNKMPFWDRTIELVVSTHPDQDHLAGLTEVLRRFRVKQVLHPGLNYGSPLYDEWLSLIREKNIKSTPARRGQRIDLGGETVIKVLNPGEISPAVAGADADNHGVVLRLNIDRIAFLLTGDIGQEKEWELVRQRTDLASTVLKVAHHGADTSTTPEFLSVVDPRLAVISAGADNRFGHPADAVLDRLERRLEPENVYRTDERGTIEFITDGERLWVKTEK